MELKLSGLPSNWPEGMRDRDGLSSLSSLSWREICALRMPLMLCGSPESGVPGAFASDPAELGMPGSGVAGTERAEGIDERVSPRLSGDPRRDERPWVRPWDTCCKRGVVVPDTVPLTLGPERSPRPGDKLIAGFVTFRRSERPRLSGTRPLPLNCGHSEDFCWPREIKANMDAKRIGEARKKVDSACKLRRTIRERGTERTLLEKPFENLSSSEVGK